ncbi:MAG: SulP family inorganic anion transporter, partial [Candidatus Nanopelagicales bacterium]|nr:SulP family inorganic anion transporter [Candidatus Nanopelagicales bacterium]
MAPVTGLIGFIAGALLVAALSTNPRLTIYSDSTIAPMLAAGTLGLVAARSNEYPQVVTLTTVMVGVIVLMIGVSKLGWLSDYLSQPAVTGFMAGIAVTIFVNELPSVLGVPGSHGKPLAQLADLSTHLASISWPTLIVAVVGLTILVVAGRIDVRFPAALALLVGAILVGYWLDLPSRGVAVVGEFPQINSLASWPADSLGVAIDMFPTAVAISIVALMQTAGTTRVAAEAGEFAVDVNSDTRALGGANILSGVTGGFTVDGSPPTTALMTAMKSRSQLASLFAAVLVIGVILFGSSALADLPQVILGVVLIFISARIFDIGEMRSILSYSTSAFVVTMATMVGVLVLGVAGGLVLAFLVDIGNRARRDSRPELDRLMQDDHKRWVPATGAAADQAALVTVYRLNGPLWFANAAWFRRQVLTTLHHDGEDGRVLVIDTSGMDDIDYTGAKALERLIMSCRHRRVQLALVDDTFRLRKILSGSDVLHLLGTDHVYRTIKKALAAIGPGRGGEHLGPGNGQ